MANHNQILQMGFFSAKELEASETARASKFRVRNENVANKQEFAKVYSQSLHKNPKTVKDKTSTNKQPEPAAKKQQTAKANQQSKQTKDSNTAHSSTTDAAESGRKLPQTPKDDQAQQQDVISSDISVHENGDETPQEAVGLGFGANYFDKTHGVGSEIVEHAAGALTVERLGQPPSSSSEDSAVALNATRSTLLSPTVELGETSDPAQDVKTSPSISALHPLLRSSAEENPLKAPITTAAKQATEFSKTSLPEAGVFTNLNSGHSGQQGDLQGQQSVRQQSALLNDRLFSLAMHNSGQPGSASVHDLNNVLAQHTAQLSAVSSDQAVPDINVHAAKEPLVTPRVPGNPLQMFSPMLNMTAGLENKGWSSEVGQRVMWMVNKDLQQAQLQLNPKHLGPMEIKITMTADQQINVNFLTHSSTVKEALDQALPRLREVFDQSGLNLNDVNIQHDSHRQQREQHHTAEQKSVGESYLAETMQEDAPVAQILHSRSWSSSIVDFYA